MWQIFREFFTLLPVVGSMQWLQNISLSLPGSFQGPLNAEWKLTSKFSLTIPWMRSRHRGCFFKICSLSRNRQSDHRVGFTQRLHLLCSFCNRASLSNWGSETFWSYWEASESSIISIDHPQSFYLLNEGTNPWLERTNSERQALSYTGKLLKTQT